MVWYDLAVSFDAMYAELRETYHQPSFLSLRLWGKHIVWYAVLGVLGTPRGKDRNAGCLCGENVWRIEAETPDRRVKGEQKWQRR